jgi:hypothetical protein
VRKVLQVLLVFRGYLDRQVRKAFLDRLGLQDPKAIQALQELLVRKDYPELKGRKVWQVSQVWQEETELTEHLVRKEPKVR